MTQPKLDSNGSNLKSKNKKGKKGRFPRVQESDLCMEFDLLQPALAQESECKSSEHYGDRMKLQEFQILPPLQSENTTLRH